jgi:hypothetical protein
LLPTGTTGVSNERGYLRENDRVNACEGDHVNAHANGHVNGRVCECREELNRVNFCLPLVLLFFCDVAWVWFQRTSLHEEAQCF